MKLPFKSQPPAYDKVTVGDDAVGSIEIPKYNGLLVNEQIYIDAQLSEIDNPNHELIGLVDEIATRTGTPWMDVYNLAIGGNNIEFISKFGAFGTKILQIEELYKKYGSKKIDATVTAILSNRVLPDWKPEDTGNPEELHPGLKQAIAQFAANEQNGWKIPDPTPIPTTPEEAGNLPPLAAPTGEPSSGNSELTGQPTTDSAPVVSADNQPG